ncbi:ABC transporter ATP-binding protein [Arthrobacter psychrolactophilus]
MTQQTPSTTALSIRNATLEMGDGDSKVIALDNVNLEVAAGEFLAIVGPSGSGKSSLLAVAGALSAPDSGTVTVNGQELTGLSQGKLAAFRLANIGFVFQQGNPIPALSAADQLRLVNKLSGDRAALIRCRCWTRWAWLTAPTTVRASSPVVSDSAWVLPAPSSRARSCSWSMSPRRPWTRARSHEVVELLARESHEHGVATIMVTHDHDVLGACDRVLELVDGKLSAPVSVA